MLSRTREKTSVLGIKVLILLDMVVGYIGVSYTTPEPLCLWKLCTHMAPCS